jgi:hypothetical protein
MMEAAMIRAIDISLGSGLTSQLVDRKRAVMAIRSAQNPADRLVVMELVLEKRRNHRVWLTLAQRKWQGQTRRPSRARHHDSIAIREKYVRCNAN